jgi:hypothetical protein
MTRAPAATVTRQRRRRKTGERSGGDDNRLGHFAGYRAEKDESGVQLNPSISLKKSSLKTKRPSPTSCYFHIKEIKQAKLAY